MKWVAGVEEERGGGEGHAILEGRGCRAGTVRTEVSNLLINVDVCGDWGLCTV